MNAIRIQIHLEHMFEENVPNEFYSFWYAFHPSKIRTIQDLLKDLYTNYLKPQLSVVIEKIDQTDEHSFIIQLDNCQLLPFSSSQILRDNDRLTLMPLTKYKLHKQTLQDSANFNVSAILPAASDPTPTAPRVPPVSTSIPASNSTAAPVSATTTMMTEKTAKRVRADSMEQNGTIESNISVTSSSTQNEENSKKKKKKTKVNEEPINMPPVEPSVSTAVPEATMIEKEVRSESPPSLSSTAGRLREIKSKTPKWKEQQSRVREKLSSTNHIRFDSDSDEEPSPVKPTITIEKSTETTVPTSNGTIEPNPPIDPPAPAVVEPVKPSDTPKSTPKKTLDLLFEMKQCKDPAEQKAKKIKQQFSKKRAQHRKRAIQSLALSNYVDHAFGLDQATREKHLSSTENVPGPITPQSLPTSFNKMARLPLIAEAIETHDKAYDLYPPLQQCPPVHTRIAFKLLELSADFCPVLSDFKEGTVVDANPATGELTLEIDQPLTTVFDEPSKFYAPDEEEPKEESKTVTLSFAELKSARVLSTSNGNGTH